MRLILQLSCYDGARYLPYLFRSLRAQTFKDWRLMVLDNASRPEEAKAIRRAVSESGVPAELHRVDRNIGFAGAHDFLFAKHDAEYVQLLNDDAFLEPGYLERCIAFLDADPEHAAVSGKILRWDFDRRDAPEGGRTRIIDSLGLVSGWTRAVRDIGAGRAETDAMDLRVPRDVFGVSGCLPMYRASSVKRVSPDGTLFDAAFVSYKEDVDLAFRLQAAGYRAAMVPSAVAYHRRSIGAGIKRPASSEARYRSYRNHLWLLMTHAPTQAWFSTELGALPYEAAKFVYWLFRRPGFLLKTALDTYAQRSHLKKKRAFVLRLRRERGAVPPRDAIEADIAVVMVSHDDLNDACLASLSQACKATALQVAIVIVDNASVAYRANELVDRHFDDAITLLRDDDYGFGCSCNRGAREVNAKYYFFLNPDTRLDDPGIFDALFAYMEARPKVGLVAPKVLYFDGRLQETCRRYPKWYMPFVQRTFLKNRAVGKAYTDSFQMADYDHLTEKSVDWVQGSAMLIRGGVWRAMDGGFDQRYFMYFEDIDLCRRIRLAGHDVVYLPSTTLRHAHGKESAKLPGLIKNLLYNPMARAHLISWAKYLLKWRAAKPPSADTRL